MITDALPRVFAALADPTRRDMVARLSEGDAAVSQLAVPYRMSLQAVYKHLRVLENAGLVRRTVRGREHILSLDAAPLAEAAEWVEHYRRFWGEQLASLDAFVTNRDDAVRSP